MKKSKEQNFPFYYDPQYQTTLLDLTFLFKINSKILNLKDDRTHQIMDKFFDIFKQKTPIPKNLYYNRGRNVIAFFVYDTSSLCNSKKVFETKRKISRLLKIFDIDCSPKEILAFNTDKPNYLQKWFNILKTYRVDEVYLNKFMRPEQNHKIFLVSQRIRDLLQKGRTMDYFLTSFRATLQEGKVAFIQKSKDPEKHIKERVKIMQTVLFFTFLLVFDVDIEMPPNFSLKNFIKKATSSSPDPEQIAKATAEKMQYLFSVSRKRFVMNYPEIELL